jgi:CRISPR-associated protein Cst2
MTRHEGDPVPHEHEFYRAVLKGLFSLDLRAAGTFSYLHRTGFLNLDDNRRADAQRRSEAGTMEHLESLKAYRLPFQERHQRVAALLHGLGLLAGGAKQALHYTDVTPVAVLAVVTRGGNNPLHYAIGPGERGEIAVNDAALQETVGAWHDQFLSPLYVGWVRGFQDDQRDKLESALERLSTTIPTAHVTIADGAADRDNPVEQEPHAGGSPSGTATSARISHPRWVLGQLARDLGDHPEWWA